MKNFRVISAVAAALASAVSSAAPTGGSVVGGVVTIQSSPGTTTIRQASPTAALDWQGFDIGAAEAVRFIQPDAQSVALNRVLGGNPSTILGSLTANGKVFLVNPNGILFGKGAQVAVGGLVASTRDIAVADFMAGHYRFAGERGTAVINEGSIRADGGYVALLGARVGNDGSIVATQGTIALAAGSGFTLDVGGDGLLNVAVDAGAVDALSRNGGLIQADGGRVLLTARSASGLLSSAVNNTGIVRAQTLYAHGGTIALLGDSEAGSVSVDGVLDASAPGGGNGGFIETSAAKVKIAAGAAITTAAVNGATGQWLIDPVDFTIAASDGDMTGATLSSQLANSDVILMSTAGVATGRGDLLVNDSVSWSANQLTLNAQANIIVNAPLAASGTASLALAYGQAAVNAGNTSQLSVRAPVGLPTGNNLTVQQGSDGAVTSYSVINSMAALQDINNGLAGNYALGSDLDASAFSGYVPIGSSATRFTGTFNGLAHTISNLNVSSGNDNAGLFGMTDTSALITSLRMSNTFVDVGGRNNAGSLVGWNYGTVRDVYTAGVTIYAARQAGGLVGLNAGLIESSVAASGYTNATFFSGGLVAYQISPGVIRNSYSGVNSGSYLEVGGLVGGMDGGSIESSYANASPSGSTATFGTGGLVGYTGGGTVTNSYWNASKYAVGTRTGSSTGMTGLSTTAMQSQASFTPAGTAAGEWDFANVWVMYEGLTMPLLRAFMTPLTVSANSATTPYSGAAYNGTPGLAYSRAPNLGNILGTATYTSAGTNAGTHALTPSGLYSNQLGYLIAYAAGTLTISPYAVSLTGSRAYDGSNVIAANVLSLGTLANGETLSLSGDGTVASGNAGAGKSVTLGTLALVSGTGVASNYTFAGGAQTVTIVPAGLTATAAAADKAYDGTTLADATLTASGFIGSETLGIAATSAFNSKDVATANLVTVNTVTLSDGSNGGLAGNYTLAGGQTAVAHITPQALTAAATAADKVYDGTTLANATLTASGLIGSETLGIAATSAFNSKDVATANLVTVNTVTLSDGSNGGLATNYSVASGQTAAARITPKALVVLGQVTGDKVYDGGATASLSAGAVSGVVSGETVDLLQSGLFASPEVGERIAVTATDALSGTAAANYSLLQPTGLMAAITAVPVAPVTPVAPPAPPADPVREAVASEPYRGALAAVSGSLDAVPVGGIAIAAITIAPLHIGSALEGLALNVVPRDEETQPVEAAP